MKRIEYLAVQLTCRFNDRQWLKLILALLEFSIPTGTCLESSPATKTQIFHKYTHTHTYKTANNTLSTEHAQKNGVGDDEIITSYFEMWGKLDWCLLRLTAVHCCWCCSVPLIIIIISNIKY